MAVNVGDRALAVVVKLLKARVFCKLPYLTG